MRPFRDLSIKRKLTMIIMLTSGIALVFASGALMYSNIKTSEKILRNDLSSLASVIGANSVGAIVFDDQQTAEQNLAGLHAKPDVALACIYDRNGKIFATYMQKGAGEVVQVPQLRDPGQYYEGNYLLVYSPILQWTSTIGTVCIQFDLRRTQKETLRSAAIFGIILFFAFVIIWVLSFHLQKVVSRPIMRLTEIARVVSEKKDFSVRAEKFADDEIGVLIDVFNGMLAQIQSRDEKLREYREHLEEQVASRTIELRQANKMLQSAKDAAESANRAKSEFLANMSHEIRTPLNTVLGFSDLLRSLITDESQKSYLAAIISSGKGLLSLINGILDLSKIEAGKMDLQYEAVNPHAIFEEVRNIFALQAFEKKIDFSVVLDSEIPDCLMLDEVRLKQILFNLIGNAVKFTEQGYVRITVKKGEETEDPSDIPLTISVEDTGIGIPEQFHDEIFEAFRQKDGQSTKQFGGTGLGLSITKRLVEMMGGTISVHSENNRGSRFDIFIPHVKVTEAEHPAEFGDTFDPETIRFNEATVLIADTIASNRSLIKAFLHQTPLVLIEANNGETATNMARECKPDVILMDRRISGEIGPDATANICLIDEACRIPIIAMTAAGAKGEKEALTAKGFSGYLTKPLQKAALFKELSRFLPHHTLQRGDAGQALTASPVNPDRLPMVIERLEKEYRQTWETVRKNQFFNEIEDFGTIIAKLGEENAIGGLTTYGQDLSAYAARFDVEKMNTTLDAYPQLIQNIKAISASMVKEEANGSEK